MRDIAGAVCLSSPLRDTVLFRAWSSPVHDTLEWHLGAQPWQWPVSVGYSSALTEMLRARVQVDAPGIDTSLEFSTKQLPYNYTTHYAQQ